MAVICGRPGTRTPNFRMFFLYQFFPFYKMPVVALPVLHFHQHTPFFFSTNDRKASEMSSSFVVFNAS